jgi:hypothetical protein
VDPDSLGSLNPDLGGPNDSQKWEKVLDVLFSGLEASPVAWTSLNEA